MPTYQYVCTECGAPTEAVQSFTDAPLAECPACQGRLRKVFSAVGVVFKGSGFYKNDSRAAAGKGNGSGSTSEGSGDAGGDKAAANGDKPAADKKPAEKSGDKPAVATPAAASASGSGSGSASSGKVAKSA